MRTPAISTRFEKWTEDEQHITDLLFAGSNLDKARNAFARFIKSSHGHI